MKVGFASEISDVNLPPRIAVPPARPFTATVKAKANTFIHFKRVEFTDTICILQKFSILIDYSII
jgi:hypothetical protein